jgi:hypothetical protein
MGMYARGLPRQDQHVTHDKCVTDTYLDVSGAPLRADAFRRRGILGIVISMTNTSRETSGGGGLRKVGECLRCGYRSTRG